MWSPFPLCFLIRSVVAIQLLTYLTEYTRSSLYLINITQLTDGGGIPFGGLCFPDKGWSLILSMTWFILLITPCLLRRIREFMHTQQRNTTRGRSLQSHSSQGSSVGPSLRILDWSVCIYCHLSIPVCFIFIFTSIVKLICVFFLLQSAIDAVLTLS